MTQEPVAWMSPDESGLSFHKLRDDWVPLYTMPKHDWVGLTEQDFSAINQSCITKLQAATSAESILKGKNNG